MVLMRNKKNYPSIIIKYPLLSRALCKFVLFNSGIRWVFLFQNNPKNLDPYCKTELYFCGCMCWKGRNSYNRMTIVHIKNGHST